MTADHPIWPARLNHLCLDTPDPEAMIAFYRDGLAMTAEEIGPGHWRLDGPERRLLLRRAEAAGLGYAGFAIDGEAQLAALRVRIQAAGCEISDNPSPFLRQDAFAVADPDGNLFCFGAPSEALSVGSGIAGRLQHVVVATEGLPAMMDFQDRVLGTVTSDHVLADDGAITAAFYRSDPEHHSFACFGAPEAGLDHHAYEVPDWNAIRDWADLMADLRVTSFWGPGRHGPGNNLFLMVLDPDGNKIEFSAELEHMPIDMAHRDWPHEERTLNLWGGAWMRS